MAEEDFFGSFDSFEPVTSQKYFQIKSEDDAVLSRRRQKEEDKTAYHRAKNIEKRKAHRAKKREERRAFFATLTAEEYEAVNKEHQIKRKLKKEQLAQQRAKMVAMLDDKNATTINIDCSYEDKMGKLEIKSLVDQCNYSYSYNVKSTCPVRFSMTSLGGETLDGLVRRIGYPNWRALKSEDYFTDVFDLDKIVYLTPDSPNEMEEFEEGKVYCIGGIIDRNLYKGLSYTRCVDLGVPTARLPVAKYATTKGAPVLTVNHMVLLLLTLRETKSWEKAFEAVIPARRFIAPVGASSSDGQKLDAEEEEQEEIIVDNDDEPLDDDDTSDSDDEEKGAEINHIK